MDTRRREGMVCLSVAFGLAACGGGGGGSLRGGGSLPNPVSSANANVPCQVSGASCTFASSTSVRTGFNTDRIVLVDSQVVLGGAQLYGFTAGTEVRNGSLQVASDSRLDSNVNVWQNAGLNVSGELRGNVRNEGSLSGGGIIQGNLVNEGSMGTDLRVAGNFVQTANGIFTVTLPGPDNVFPTTPGLSATGTASLAGTLRLNPVYAWDETGDGTVMDGPYTLHLVHADGGVSGAFDKQTLGLSLVLTGSVRYAPSDVYLDVLRASFVMVTSTGTTDSAAVSGAERLDAVLAQSPGTAASTAASRQMHSSLHSLLWMQDPARAEQAFAAVSGSDVARALAQPRAAHGDPGLDAWLLRARRGTGERYQHTAYDRQGEAGAFVVAPDWLVGYDRTIRPIETRGTRYGIGADGQTARLILRHVGATQGYAGLHVEGSREDWRMRRTLDLDAAGRHQAWSQRRVDSTTFGVEAGKRFRFGGGWLVPAIRADWTRRHSDAFVEYGTSGFELIADAHNWQETVLDARLHFARDGRVGTLPLQLDLAGGYRQFVGSPDNTWHAAFTGLPSYRFALPGARGQSGVWWQMGLRGGHARRTTWHFHDHHDARLPRDEASTWALQLSRPIWVTTP